MKHISSIQNPLIKAISELQLKSKERKKQKQFVVEGFNEIRLCAASGYQIKQLFFCEDYTSFDELQTLLGNLNEIECITVDLPVFEKLAYRKHVANAIACVAEKSQSLEDLTISNNALILVAENIEKPGNLGALMRTADAMNATAVVITGTGCDIYNPNAIRGSVGCVFTVPVIHCSNEAAQVFLEKHGINVFTTFMTEAKASWNTKISTPAAVVVGTESTGLTEDWRKKEYQNINIEMMGKVDSLNVSVAVSLLLYEARRQNRNDS